jgi:DNA-binding GntR family transcriptional regulator
MTDDGVIGLGFRAMTELDRSRPMRDQLYAIIRRRIVTGEILPGQVINEKAIAAEMGISRTPVRESLKKLSDEGLVDIAPQAGIYAARISRAQVDEAHIIRSVLEIENVRRAALRMTPDHEALLDDIHMRHTRTIERGRYHDAIDLDDAFHRAIGIVSGLTGLWRLVAISKAPLDRCRHMTIPEAGKAEETLRQHRLIFQALARRDADAAAAAMKNHLETAYATTSAFLDRHLELTDERSA